MAAGICSGAEVWQGFVVIVGRLEYDPGSLVIHVGKQAMSDGWHYVEGEKAVGPVDLKKIEMVFSKISDPRNLRVWKAGFEDWKRAGEVPELAEIIPPPLPKAPALSEKTATPITKRREWKWHFLQGTLQALILSGFAVSDVLAVVAK